MNTGRDLSIKSLQDTDDYSEQSHSAGIAAATGGTAASADKGKINSDYQSTADQSGIYAGKGGFNINVGKNTDLKGAVIDSDAAPDKNKLSTDTLTYSDIANKASYDSKNTGINYNTGKDVRTKDKGLTPDIGTEAKGNAGGTTKSAIAPGIIDIRSNPGQDISGLSRDTKDALNQLSKIFDKEKVKEQQELARLFGEEAYKTIGKLAAEQVEKAVNDENNAIKNGNQAAYAEAKQREAMWENGGQNKVELHAVIGGIMSYVGGSGFSSGAAGAGLNEIVQKQLEKVLKNNPDLWQWASTVIGAAAAKAAAQNAQSGASIAASGTKNNELSDILLHPITVSAGIKEGLYEEVGDMKDDFMSITEHPLDTLNGIKEMVTEIYDTPSLLAQIGENELNKIQAEINTIENGTAYETGKGIGKLAVEVVFISVGAGLGEKLAAKVPELIRAVETIKNASGFKLDDVIVTAEKGSQNAQKVKDAETVSAIEGAGKALVRDTGSISKNTENLRTWAKDNGWVQQNTAGGVEQWGIKNADGTFSWRLKLKPEASTREGLGAGSNQPRFDARLDDKGTYINPFTGETGGRGVGTHIPLGE